MTTDSKVLLVILDGFGIAPAGPGNAIKNANPEFINKVFRERPVTELAASGERVGLPDGQMGNSEVGHLNIGAGRVVYQDITRINKSISDRSFFENEALANLIERVKSTGKSLHLFGLVSDGGVHSMNTHVYACLELARSKGLDKVFIHAFMDGRDTSPTSGAGFIRKLVAKTEEIKCGKIATVSGRYYAMDRDNRWDRVEKAYNALVQGVGARAVDPATAVEASYKLNITDEFINPVVIESDGKPVALIDDGDGILAFNFRADRMRQIVKAFIQERFDKFPVKPMKVDMVSFVRYSAEFDFPVAFAPQSLDNVLGEVLSRNRIPQLRLAETEKYAHVTYFTNGGREEPFELEDRIMIPSPKVKTYDLKPEMAAFEVGDALREDLRQEKHPFIMVNLANCDMVGHTGIIEAAQKAVTAVDSVLSKVIPIAYELGYTILITSDHGNAEQLLDEKTGEPFTEHTTNKVPFCVVSRPELELRSDGALPDIAPTVLEIMKIPQPAEMTGKSLVIWKNQP